jgi:hypothetical protein
LSGLPGLSGLPSLPSLPSLLRLPSPPSLPHLCNATGLWCGARMVDVSCFVVQVQRPPARPTPRHGSTLSRLQRHSSKVPCWLLTMLRQPSFPCPCRVQEAQLGTPRRPAQTLFFLRGARLADLNRPWVLEMLPMGKVSGASTLLQSGSYQEWWKCKQPLEELQNRIMFLFRKLSASRQGFPGILQTSLPRPGPSLLQDMLRMKVQENQPSAPPA